MFFSDIIANSIFLGIVSGFFYGCIFTWEKKRRYKFLLARKENNEKLTISRAFSFSTSTLIRYFLLLVIIYLLVSKYKISLFAFALSFIFTFWLYIILMVKIRSPR